MSEGSPSLVDIKRNLSLYEEHFNATLPQLIPLIFISGSCKQLKLDDWYTIKDRQ